MTFDANQSAIFAVSALTSYYRSALAVGVLIVAAVAMVTAMLTVGRGIRPHHPEEEKYIVYESGSDPIGTFGQSNVRYYVFALLFVIFDIEAVFVFPWAVNVNELGWFGLIAVGTFVLVLLLGLLYDWRKGLLKWA